MYDFEYVREHQSGRGARDSERAAFVESQNINVCNIHKHQSTEKCAHMCYCDEHWQAIVAQNLIETKYETHQFSIKTECKFILLKRKFIYII